MSSDFEGEDYTEYDDFADDNVYSEEIRSDGDSCHDDVVERERKVEDLKHICLECISKNFQRFNTAYNTSEDPEVQRNLKFLQKFHSAHFLCEMTEDGSLDEKYLKFLVNEYLKDLEVGTLTGDCGWDSIIKRMAEVGHSFLKVSFEHITEGANAVPFINSIIAHLPNVNVLRPTSYCNDETLKIISATCAHLKDLCIDGSSITDEGLKSLCLCTSLNAISLLGIQNIEKGVAYLLKNMPSLEVIDYSTVPEIIISMHKQDIENNCLDSVQGYNLTTLQLTTESDNLSAFTKLCPRVKELSVPVRKEEDVKLISSFSELEDLTAYHRATESLHYPNLDDFLKSSDGRMRKLDLHTFAFSTNRLIEMCPKLESLTLRDVSFRVAEKEKNVRKLNNLRKLCFENLKFADSFTEQSVAMLLNSAPNVERLEIILCHFQGSDEISPLLSKFCERSCVEHITFRLCDIDEPLLTSILLSNMCLQTLTIEDCARVGYGELQNLYSIAHSSKNRVEIIWQEDENGSDFDSDYQYGDFFDLHSEYDDSDGWDADYGSDCDYDDGDDF